MAITVQWDNPERTIIRWDFERAWAWDELADSAKVSGAMIAGADADIDIILNVGTSQIPKGRLSPYQRSAFAYTPSNIRLLVLVSGTEFDGLQVILPFFQQMELAETLDQARAMLQLQPV